MAKDKDMIAYTFTAAASELGLSAQYVADLVEQGKLTETKQVRGTRERFVTAESVERLKQQRANRGGA